MFEFVFLLFPLSKAVLKPTAAELLRKIKILSFVVRLYLLLFNNAKFIWKVPNSYYLQEQNIFPN